MGGAAHGRLWDALRKKGRQVRVIGIAAENQTVDRTVRVLRAWVAAPAKRRPEKVTEGVSIDDYSTWFAERFAVAGQDLKAEKARLRPEDLGLVRTARRSHNQHGLAYQIAFIRLTGRAPGQQPFEIIEDLVGYGTTSSSTASTSSTAVSCEAKGLAYKFARFWALPSLRKP